MIHSTIVGKEKLKEMEILDTVGSKWKTIVILNHSGAQNAFLYLFR